MYRILQRLIGLHLFVINSRPLDGSRAAATTAAVPDGEHARRVVEADWPGVCAEPQADISREFLDAALARGDVCIGYFVGTALVSYFWCGFSRVPAQAGLEVCVPSGYSYAYKALTVPDHRGRHLQQILTEVNDAMLINAGLRHNIEYIEVDNYAQLKASARYGNTTLGQAGYFRWGPYVHPFRTRGVARVGFAFAAFANKK
ncbi:MAG: hypothetical protein AAF993_11490 [Pseudomonadota bacterium]